MGNSVLTLQQKVLDKHTGSGILAPMNPAAPRPLGTVPTGKLHAAIILDGSGRWAVARGKPRAVGHAAGVEAVRRTIAAAPGIGISTLTLFAFSSNNWERPSRETAALMELLERFLRSDAAELARAGVRVNIIGRRDRLPISLRAAIEAAERVSAGGIRLHLRLALDYSAREAILRAACRMYAATEISQESFAKLLGGAVHDAPSPDVDLLIRTGGEQRLSDFLLWECAYAELIFLPKLWPEFSAADLADAVREYHRRERRFGRLPEAAAG